MKTLPTGRALRWAAAVSVTLAATVAGCGTVPTNNAAAASTTVRPLATAPSTATSVATPTGSTAAAATPPVPFATAPGGTSSAEPTVLTSSDSARTSNPSALTSPPGSVADPTRVVGAAWLSAAQMPDTAAAHWKRPASPTVSDPRAFGMDRVFPMCVALDPGPGHQRWVGAQELDFSGYHGTASQITVIYPDAPSAHAAYAATVRSCDGLQALTRSWQSHPMGNAAVQADAVVTRTGDVTDGSAWTRRWTGIDSPSSKAGFQINHQYIVQRGAVLTAVSFDEGPAPTVAMPYDTAGDSGLLRTIASEICLYSDTCS